MTNLRQNRLSLIALFIPTLHWFAVSTFAAEYRIEFAVSIIAATEDRLEFAPENVEDDENVLERKSWSSKVAESELELIVKSLPLTSLPTPWHMEFRLTTLSWFTPFPVTTALLPNPSTPILTRFVAPSLFATYPAFAWRFDGASDGSIWKLLKNEE